ncbi:DUF397 domain-containing protein [Streptomyces sp. NPDC001833]
MIRKNSAGEPSGLAWFKSGYSDGPDGDSCVEVALAPAAWSAFLPCASAH